MARKRAADPEVQHFKYLNRLRANGRTNMYGAIPYLMESFGLERTAAFEVVCRWVDAFERRRAEAAGAGGGEISVPAPPKPASAPAPVVVHRPRRGSRARPPKNRKPLPEVRVELRKAEPAKPPKKARGATAKPAKRSKAPKASKPAKVPKPAKPSKTPRSARSAAPQRRRAAAQMTLELDPPRR